VQIDRQRIHERSDLEVEGTHSFIADGVVMHNSNIRGQRNSCADTLGPWFTMIELAITLGYCRKRRTPRHLPRVQHRREAEGAIRGADRVARRRRAARVHDANEARARSTTDRRRPDRRPDRGAAGGPSTATDATATEPAETAAPTDPGTTSSRQAIAVVPRGPLTEELSDADAA
jgi:hypothetical protein